MDPTTIGALFTALGAATGILSLWAGQKWRTKEEGRELRKTERKGIESKLDSIDQRLDTHGEVLEGVRGDVTWLKTRVAVHDDRFGRLRPVPGEDAG